MRIGIVGDIHGNYEALKEAVRRLGRIDLLIFTGDGYRDISRLIQETGIHVEGALGNCDFYSEYPVEQVLGYDGYRILITHGHKYDVKNGLTRIGMAGREMQVDVVIFGHTHQAMDSEWLGVRMFNPGALSREKSYEIPSFGLIETSANGIKTKILRLGDMEPSK